MTLLRVCTCQSTFQDRVYGPGMRVHNFARSSPDKVHGGWRCTVCGHDRVDQTGKRVRAVAKPA